MLPRSPFERPNPVKPWILCAKTPRVSNVPVIPSGVRMSPTSRASLLNRAWLRETPRRMVLTYLGEIVYVCWIIHIAN